jgi:excisionase family DNA binding protein
MTPDAEQRIRDAAARFAEELIAAVGDVEARGAPDRLLSVAEAAKTLGIGRTRLYAELQAGRVRSVRSGRRRLVPSSTLADFALSPAEGS